MSQDAISSLCWWYSIIYLQLELHRWRCCSAVWVPGDWEALKQLWLHPDKAERPWVLVPQDLVICHLWLWMEFAFPLTELVCSLKILMDSQLLLEESWETFTQIHLVCQLHIFWTGKPCSWSFMFWSFPIRAAAMCSMWGCSWRPSGSYNWSRMQWHAQNWAFLDLVMLCLCCRSCIGS